ncbi:cysteine-rich venom protein pseudechetoxin-like isoform X2 [Ambystoma mexicanum]|uniref:cysteine-rich venom protein pseudechetoxin-like isoform X2 n=1 Tax=Ambystoma mexicanum TaxID=8296 RepID=UPI0037E75BF4
MRRFGRPQVLLPVYLTLLWVAANARRTDYTQEEMRILLDLHNAYRSRVEPSAANMMKLEWHDELASMAQDWADQCTFEHGQPHRDQPPFDDIGQNLNKFMSSDPARLDSLYSRTNIPLKTWWDEVAWYNFPSSQCSGPVCGHYTQLVWARTQYLGCGYLNGSRCPGTFTYVVCNYGPTGNKGLTPKHPYLPGEPCSKCDSGRGWCEQGLCIKCPNQHCDCPLKCKNCGTLNPRSCTCTCSQGWDYADCSVFSGKGPNRQRCCGGKICHNRGYLDSDDCACICRKGYFGKYCEISRGHRPANNWILVLSAVAILLILITSKSNSRL